MKKIVLAALLVCLGAGLAFYLAGPAARPGQAQAGSPQLVLYTGENFTGRSVIVQGTVLDLPKEEEQDGSLFDWNDQVRSLVVVSGTWRLYQNGRCNTLLDDTAVDAVNVATKQPVDGWSAVLSATSTSQLEVPDLSALGIGGDISSVELIAQTNLPDWALGMRNP